MKVKKLEGDSRIHRPDNELDKLNKFLIKSSWEMKTVNKKSSTSYKNKKIRIISAILIMTL